MSCLLSYSFDTYSENLATNPYKLGYQLLQATSVQMPRRFFKSNPLRRQIFLTATKIFLRVREESVSIGKKILTQVKTLR